MRVSIGRIGWHAITPERARDHLAQTDQHKDHGDNAERPPIAVDDCPLPCFRHCPLKPAEDDLTYSERAHCYLRPMRWLKAAVLHPRRNAYNRCRPVSACIAPSASLGALARNPLTPQDPSRLRACCERMRVRCRPSRSARPPAAVRKRLVRSAAIGPARYRCDALVGSLAHSACRRFRLGLEQ